MPIEPRPTATRLLRTLSWGAAVVALLCAAVWGWARLQPADAAEQTLALSYRQEIGMRFAADVLPGAIYPSSPVLPEVLPRWQTQAEPPIYRRALLLGPVKELAIEFPYAVEFNRPVEATGTVSVRATLVGQRIWQRPLAPAEPVAIHSEGQKMAGRFRLALDPRALEAELAEVYAAAGLAPGSGEVVLEPLLEWTVAGEATPAADAIGGGTTTREPITGSVAGAPTTLFLMGRHVEIEERPATTNQQRVFSTVRRPVIVTLGDSGVSLDRLSQVAGALALALASVAAVAAVAAPRGRGTVADRGLTRLAIVSDVQDLTIGPETVRVQLRTPKDIIRLHASTGHPIIRTRSGYHLLDGGICYSFYASDAGTSEEPVDTSSAPPTLGDAAGTSGAVEVGLHAPPVPAAGRRVGGYGVAGATAAMALSTGMAMPPPLSATRGSGSR